MNRCEYNVFTFNELQALWNDHLCHMNRRAGHFVTRARQRHIVTISHYLHDFEISRFILLICRLIPDTYNEKVLTPHDDVLTTASQLRALTSLLRRFVDIVKDFPGDRKPTGAYQSLRLTGLLFTSIRSCKRSLIPPWPRPGLTAHFAVFEA